MNLLWEFDQLKNGSRKSWCHHHGVFLPRMTRLKLTCDNLVNRVATFLKIDSSTLFVDVPPREMHHSMVLILRVLLVWVFNDSIIEIPPNHAALGIVKVSNEANESFSVPLNKQSEPILFEHLKPIFSKMQHQPTLNKSNRLKYSGTFKILQST